jgi:GcrA cell cycle regulator
MEPEPEIEAYDNVIPMGQRRTLLELTEETCRWPIGDPSNPEFYFCGGKPIPSLPYCSHHSRIAYQPVNERRRNPRPPFRQG